jgi:hypothetical protein
VEGFLGKGVLNAVKNVILLLLMDFGTSVLNKT